MKVKTKLMQLQHGIIIKQLFQNQIRFINFQQTTTKKLKLQKKKHLRKKIGSREKSNKISAEWLKTAGYLDTKDQDKINYIFIPPEKIETNNIPTDSAHFIRTEMDSIDFKKENLVTKKKDKRQKNHI